MKKLTVFILIICMVGSTTLTYIGAKEKQMMTESPTLYENDTNTDNTPNKKVLEVGSKFEEGNITYIVKDDITLEVIDCVFTGASIHIPEIIFCDGYDYEVTSIGDSAFADCESLTSVTVPNSVTSIGGFTFSNLRNLLLNVYPDSYALQYAQSNNYSYNVIGTEKSIELKKSSLILSKGNSLKLNDTIMSDDVINNKLSWSSNGHNAATVDKNCNTEARNVGDAIITARTSNGKTATYSVIVSEPIIEAETVNLNKSNLSLITGTSEQLYATVNPDNTTNKNVSWSSDNEDIVTVDEDGNVTAINPGTAIITVSTSNGKTANCLVKVSRLAVEVVLNKTDIRLRIGATEKLIPTINPIDTTNKSLIWISDNENVAFVDGSGNVIGVSGGTATITVRSSNGKSAKCFVVVKDPATSVNLNHNKISLTCKSSKKLNAIVKPLNITDSTLKWSSSNAKVAKVDSKGKVTAVNGGKATITVKTSNGKNAKCIVTVPYKITYKLNGGKNSKSNPLSYYGKRITLKSPTRKGYTFKGWYSDSKYKKKVTSFSSGNKTLYAKWSKVSVSKAKTPTLSNVKGKKLKITYSATSGAKGYQIQYSTSKKFSKPTTKSITGRSATYTLTKGKTYYVRVRAYKKDSTGSKVYGSWSSIKSKKITK